MGMTFPMLFVPMSIIGSISMVLIPSISSMMSKNDYSTIEKNITRSIEVTIFISMIFIPLYLSVGDLIGIVLFDNELSGLLLQLAAVCVLPISLCNLTGSMLNALNLEVKSFVNYIFGSIVLFLSLIIFTPIIGVNSIIVAFFLSMTTITLLNLKKIRKVVPHFKFNLLKISAKYGLISAPTSIIGHFVSNICLHFFNPFFSAVAGGGVAIIISFILIKIFNIYDFNDIKDLILKKKRKKSTN